MSQSEDLSSFEIRRMVEADLSQVSAIESRAYADPWSLQLLQESLAAPMTHCIAITQESLVVGYAIYQVIFTEGHLLNIAIDPRQQKKGIGAQLLKEVLRQAQQLGALSVFLEVRPSNESAIYLYEKQGFRKLMVREKYYSNGEDAVVMVVDL